MRELTESSARSMVTGMKAVNMRRWRRIAIFLVLFFPLLAGAERIVFLGDSLTAGYGLSPEQAYPHLVGELLKRQGREVSIVNAGVSGDTTAGGLRRLGWILRQPVDTLFVALGANDALRGQSVEAAEANLRAIIRQARERHPGIRVVLAGMLAPPNMGADYQQAFAALFPRLAESEDVALLPFLLEGVAGQPELNLGDGIHPNEEGQRRIAREVARVLAR